MILFNKMKGITIPYLFADENTVERILKSKAGLKISSNNVDNLDDPIYFLHSPVHTLKEALTAVRDDLLENVEKRTLATPS